MASKVNASVDKYQGVKGRIHSVLHQYGFIDVDLTSVKARVYFNNRSFEDNRHTDLPASGLQVGDCVVLDFFQRPGTTRYHATSVCRQGYIPQHSSAENLPPRFDDEDGFVCVLKDSHAFVRVARLSGVTASFQKSDFEKYAGRRVAALTDVLKHGHKVRFDAGRNPDERSKTKWIVERLRFVDAIPPATRTTVVRSCSSVDTGDVALAPELVTQYGSVETVSSDHAIVRHRTGTAYLHAGVVEECLGVDVEDLRKVMQEGSEVRFDANWKGNQHGRARCCVTRVELLNWSSDAGHPVPSPVTAGEAPARRTVGHVFDTVPEAELHELQLQPRLHVSGNKRRFNEDEEIEDDVTVTCTSKYISDDERELVPSLASDEEFPSLPSHTPKDEPSVSICQNVPATVSKATASGATCMVEELDGRGTVKIAARCFYGDGAPISGNLGPAPGAGDVVKLDLMVGATADAGEVVHCDLAWQGQKPRDVPPVSAEEMLARLDVSEAEHEDPAGPDDQFLLETIDDDDLDALLGEASISDRDEVDVAPSRSWRIRDDVRATDLRSAAPLKNGEQETVNDEELRCLLTNNEVPAFARMILQHLATRNLPNSRVDLRNASTQTE